MSRRIRGFGVRGASLGRVDRDGGLVEARAEGHQVAGRDGRGLGFYLNHRIGQMAVDFAEILLLAALQHAVVADERKAEKQAEVDDGSSGHEQRHGASNPGLAYEPGDERSRGGDKGSSAGGQETEHRCRWWKIHITDVWVTHEWTSELIMYFVAQSYRGKKKASVLAGQADPFFHLIEILA